MIVSDGAGQFNVFLHALCWVHAERLINRLITVTDAQRAAVGLVRLLIWWLYHDLKLYRASPSAQAKASLSSRFDRVFGHVTGFADLDDALARLKERKAELLVALDRPEVPLNTNNSEQEIRDPVTIRKISGGTRSEDGRQCRDTFLSLKKTCQKNAISFWAYLGDRLGIPPIPSPASQTSSADAPPPPQPDCHRFLSIHHRITSPVKCRPLNSAILRPRPLPQRPIIPTPDTIANFATEPSGFRYR